jgi:hypothetical protein
MLAARRYATLAAHDVAPAWYSRLDPEAASDVAAGSWSLLPIRVGKINDAGGSSVFRTGRSVDWITTWRALVRLKLRFKVRFRFLQSADGAEQADTNPLLSLLNSWPC